ncbi:inorganic phosphate transporter [Halobacterium yunchengense]|uniref:inorganic phosphate transporter n=1 Tax=Halobacterium yunchengense TaxID=3108497 RepID=UPI0030086714
MAAGLAVMVVAALASLFMAWAIGAGSSGSTPFAPAVGANAITVMRAGFVVGILGFAGAVLQGANVSEAVGRELVVGATLSPVAATTALIIAATLVAVGVFTGYPIATAFTVTGAVVGTGLAMGGAPAWAKYQEIAALWVLVPFVGGGIAYATARGLRTFDRDAVAVPVLGAVVGAIVANIQFVFLGPPGVSWSLARAVAATVGASVLLVQGAVTLAVAAATAAVLYWDVAGDPYRGQRHFLLALGGLVAFSAGGSQVGLAVGPLLPLVGGDVPLAYVLVGGGAGLLAGSWTGAPRMIKAIAQDYSSLGPRRSIAALIPSFAIAQTAVFFGIPVSFNEIIVSAIVGSGYAASTGGGVSRRKMVFTVLAWVASLALALAVSYAGFLAVSAVT